MATSRLRGPGVWVVSLILVTWAFWFMTYQTNRLLLPSLALVCAVGGWGGAMLLIPRSSQEPTPAASHGLVGLFGFALLYSWGFTTTLVAGAKQPHPLPVALGFETREDYLTEGVSYYRMAGRLKNRLEPGEKALVIGEHRTLYLPNAIIASNWFDTPQPLPLPGSAEAEAFPAGDEEAGAGQ